MRGLAFLFVVATLALASPGHGQGAELDPSSFPPHALSGVWRIPIRTAEADPICGGYGIWASGDAYKVSFHDGFVFYPVLGKDYPVNQPFRWTTQKVLVGDTAILDVGDTSVPHQSDWRFEYRYPEITEAYDVLPNGVEQTFVLDRRPAAEGDLVVRGIVTTNLQAPQRNASHGELVFSDYEESEILTYGAAFAFDSRGRRLAITTAFDGSSIVLTVPAAWLASAEYPLTIDPVTTPIYLSRAQNTIDNCRNGELNHLFTVASRYNSLLDSDLNAFRSDDSYGMLRVGFADLQSSWNTTWGQSCTNGSGNRWAICMERTDVRNDVSLVRAYLHDHTSTTQNSGAMIYPNPPSGYSDQTPSIGGTGAHTGLPLVYLTWRRDQGINYPNTTTSEVWGVTINVNGSSGLHTPVRLSANANVDAEWPNVSKQSQGGDWVIVWQEYDNTIIDDWDIRACRVTNTGIQRSCATVGPATTSRHKMFPQVSGAAGRWLFSFLEVDRIPGNSRGDTSIRSGVALAVQRANWAGVTSIGAGPVSYLPTTGTIHMPRVRRSLAYDFNTDSHWVIVYQGMIGRLGHSGALISLTTPPNVILGPGGGLASPTEAAVVFIEDNETFALALDYAGTGTPGGLYGANFSYPAEARCTRIGFGCAGTADCITRGTLHPYAGSEFFGISLTRGLPNQGYYLYLSTAPGAFSLNAFCLLNISPPFTPLVFGTTDASGYFDVRFALPACPCFGDIYCQWLTLDGALIKGSRGLRISVR